MRHECAVRCYRGGARSPRSDMPTDEVLPVESVFAAADRRDGAPCRFYRALFSCFTIARSMSAPSECIKLPAAPA